MPNKVETQLIPPLLNQLQKPNLVTISTIDFEGNGPNVNAISWVFAKNEHEVLFAIDQRSRMIDNIKKHSNIVMTVIASESIYSIAGIAQVAVDKMIDVPLKLALIQFSVKEVRNVMFYGSKIVQAPILEKTYDKTAAEKLDQQVFAAMKKFTS